MDKKEIIKKILSSDNKPSIIVTKFGDCIACFPENITETNEVEFVRLDKYALRLQQDDFAVELLKETVSLENIVSVFSSKELFSMIENIHKIQTCNKKSDFFRKAFDRTKSIELYMLD